VQKSAFDPGKKTSSQMPADLGAHFCTGK